MGVVHGVGKTGRAVSPKWSRGCLLGLADDVPECTGSHQVVLCTPSKEHVSFMQ